MIRKRGKFRNSGHVYDNLLSVTFVVSSFRLPASEPTVHFDSSFVYHLCLSGGGRKPPFMIFGHHKQHEVLDLRGNFVRATAVGTP